MTGRQEGLETQAPLEIAALVPYPRAIATMTLGTEWLIDASGCDAAALADLDRCAQFSIAS
jgi:hypothetical protein